MAADIVQFMEMYLHSGTSENADHCQAGNVANQRYCSHLLAATIEPVRAGDNKLAMSLWGERGTGTHQRLQSIFPVALVEPGT